MNRRLWKWSCRVEVVNFWGLGFGADADEFSVMIWNRSYHLTWRSF